MWVWDTLVLGTLGPLDTWILVVFDFRTWGTLLSSTSSYFLLPPPISSSYFFLPPPKLSYLLLSLPSSSYFLLAPFTFFYFLLLLPTSFYLVWGECQMTMVHCEFWHKRWTLDLYIHVKKLSGGGDGGLYYNASSGPFFEFWHWRLRLGMDQDLSLTIATILFFIVLIYCTTSVLHLPYSPFLQYIAIMCSVMSRFIFCPIKHKHHQWASDKNFIYFQFPAQSSLIISRTCLL